MNIKEKVRIVGGNSWIEQDAIAQLKAVSEFPGMMACVGMPDLHPGKDSPIGASYLSKTIHPALVGNDVGCGMMLSRLSLKEKNIDDRRLRDMVEALNGIDGLSDLDDIEEYLERYSLEKTDWDHHLGTIGHGNHFMEMQMITDIFNQDLFHQIGMKEKHLYLTTHTGSRGLGESILRNYVNQQNIDVYLSQHNNAVTWAKANRALSTNRFCQAVNVVSEELLDITHNNVSGLEVDGCQCWLHRKGAAPANGEVVVIPGSRGDLTWVVKTIANADTLYSVAHGAGRKLSRVMARERAVEGKSIIEKMKKNRWGGVLVCGSRDLIFEEAPGAYKDINIVIQDLINAGLVEPIATLRPVLTFKNSENHKIDRKNTKKNWQQLRGQERAFKENLR